MLIRERQRTKRKLSWRCETWWKCEWLRVRGVSAWMK